MPWSPLATAQLRHFSMNTVMLLFSYSVMSDSLRPHGLYPIRLLYPWGKNTGVVAISFSRGSF